MSKTYNYFTIIGLALIAYGCKTSSYLNQNPPSNIPQLFAPSMVNTEDIEINAVFNTTLTELFFTRIIDGSFIIHHSEFIDNQWTTPKPIKMFPEQSGGSVAVDPSITRDGDTMYFLGINPEDRAKKSKPDIYVSKKINGKWQMASKVGYPVSTKEFAESYPVVVADGSIYFTSDRPGGLGKRDIYRAQYLGNGKFDIPINMGPTINSEKNQRSTYVAPDENYLITGNTSDDEKGFVISFKENGEWKTPVYLDIGEPLIDDWIYYCPYLSPDGKYFFFSRRYSNPPDSGWKGVSKGEVYWVEFNSLIGIE